MHYTKKQALDILSKNQNYIKSNFGIEKIALFGSLARDAMSSSSDIDILVNFKEPTFDHYFDLKFYLEALFQNEVDLVCQDALRPRIKPYVEKEAIYVS